MASTAGRDFKPVFKRMPQMCYTSSQTETLCIPLPEVVNKEIQKKSLVDKNKLGSQFSLFGMGEFSVGDPTAPGYSAFYPTTIQFLSAQKELNVLQ